MKIGKLLIFLLFVNCNLNNIDELHGVSGLKLKITQIKIDKSNENDIINIFGPPIVKDTFDKNIWSYFEVRKKVSFYGKKTTIVNDVVVLKFNKLGILTNFISYDLKSNNKIKFSEEITSSNAIDSGLIKSLLSSSKKRFDMINNKNP